MYIWKTKDRRALRAELEATRKNIGVRNTHDTSRLVKMAPRAERRAKGNRRAVLHHGIPVNPPHKAVIAAMYAIDRLTANRWQQEVKIARACAAFGFAIRAFIGNAEVARRARVKAACTTS